MMDYTVTGLSLQKAALQDQLGRVRPSDSFAKMLLMGKIKAVQRQLDALSASSPALTMPPDGAYDPRRTYDPRPLHEQILGLRLW